MELKEIPMDDICYDETFNCRGKIPTVSVTELARNIAANGLLQPITIMPMPAGTKHTQKYFLVAGFKRYLAHKILYATTIPAIINTNIETLQRALMINLTENVQREDLTPSQEANTVARLNKFGFTMKQIGEQVHKSTGWANTRLQLSQFPEIVRNEFDIGTLKLADVKSLHAIYMTCEEETFYNQVRGLKDARFKGKSKFAIPTEIKISERKLRSRGDIFMKMSEIRTIAGNNFGTRCLAWAAGEITDDELNADIATLKGERKNHV